jgi:hypothetical protein
MKKQRACKRLKTEDLQVEAREIADAESLNNAVGGQDQPGPASSVGLPILRGTRPPWADPNDDPIPTVIGRIIDDGRIPGDFDDDGHIPGDF